MSILFTKELIKDNIDGHYSFEKFEDGFRVITKYGRKYAFSSISKETFEVIYRKYWESVLVSCEKEQFDDKEIFFTKEELLEIKQLIILNMMYFYTINSMKINIKQSNLDYGEPWNVVRFQSQRKYGKGSIEADIAASNTLGIDVKRFTYWRVNQEFIESQR